MPTKPKTLQTAGEAGITPVAQRPASIYPDAIQQAPSNQEFLDLLNSEQGQQILSQAGVGYTPGLTMPSQTGIQQEDWFGGGAPEQTNPDYKGGLTGPNNEPLPVGAIAYDAYGRPYYGPGLEGYWKGVKARLFGDPTKSFFEGLLGGELSNPDPSKEITDLQSKYGTFGDVLKRGFVEGQGLLETPPSNVKEALGGLLTEVGGALGWASDAWNNLRAGQFEVATAPAKVVQEAVNVVMEGAQQFDYALESAIFGSVTEYNFAKSSGSTTAEALWEGATAVIDPAARMAYTGLFNEAQYAELKRQIAEGADPYLARLNLENPLAEMGGQIAMGLASGLAWNKAMKWLGLGEHFDEMVRSSTLADRAWTKLFNDWRNAEKGADELLPALLNKTKELISETTDVAQEMASKRGLRQLTSGGKRAVTKEIVHDYVMYIARETAKIGEDGKYVFDTDALTDALVKLARAFDGTDASVNEWLGYALTWSGGKNKAPELLMSPNALKTGNMLNDMLLGEGGKGEAWIAKVIKEAGGDADKLMEKLLPAVETKLEKYFPSIMDVMKAEDVRKTQMVAAGLEYTPSEAFQNIPGYMKRFAQFDESVGKGIYGPINKFFASVYMGMSPGYAIRNHLTNMFHVWVDKGPFAMIRSEDDAIRLTQSWLGWLPEAAEKGFAGPVGDVLSREMLSREWKDMSFLQKLTSATSRWSQSFELKAARKVVSQAVDDSMKKSVKAIMRSDEVIAALGPDLAKRYGNELSAQLIQKYGKVEDVVNWFKDTAHTGYYEAWKSIAGISDEDMGMLRKFGAYNLEGKVTQALVEATSDLDFEARIANLKEDIRVAVNQTMFESPMFSYDHGNAEDLSFIADGIAEGVFSNRDAELFSAREITTGNTFRAAEDAVDELQSQIQQYLAITLNKMGKTPGEANGIISKIWEPVKDEVKQLREAGHAQHKAQLNIVRLTIDAIRTGEGDVSGPLLQELVRRGYQFPSSGTVGKHEAIRFLWDDYRIQRKLAYGKTRTQAVEKVVEWFRNLPAKLQSEEVALGPLGQVIADAKGAGSDIDLPKIADEIEKMVGSNTALTRMQELETLASMWDDMDARKLAAFGGAYAIYPHAEAALEVFRRLRIPTMSEGGAPFSIQTLQHYTERGLKYAQKANPELQIADFTVDELRAANKMQPDRLKELETVLRGWMQEKLEPLGVTINDWLKPPKAGALREGAEQTADMVARNEIRLARTPDEMMDAVKRLSQGAVEWSVDEAGDLLPQGKLAQIIDPLDPRYTGDGRKWQVILSKEAMSGGLDPDFSNVDEIFMAADRHILAAEETARLAPAAGGEAGAAAAGVKKFGKAGEGGMADSLRQIIGKAPPGKDPVAWLLSGGGLDANQQEALIKALMDVKGLTGLPEQHGQLLRDFLSEALVESANTATIRTTVSHEMAHMLERAVWSEGWDAVHSAVKPGSDLERMHALFGGALGPGDRRLTQDGAEFLAETVIALSRHDSDAEALEAIKKAGYAGVTEEHLRMAELLASKEPNLAGLVDAVSNPTRLEGIVNAAGDLPGIVGRGSHPGLAGVDITIPTSAFQGGTHDWSVDLNAKHRMLRGLEKQADASRSGQFSLRAMFTPANADIVSESDAEAGMLRALTLMYGGDSAQATAKWTQIKDSFNTMKLGDWQIWRAVNENMDDSEAHAFMTALLKTVPPETRSELLTDTFTMRGVYVPGKGWQFSDEWPFARILGRATNTAESSISDAGLTIARRPGQPFVIEGLESYGNDYEAMGQALLELTVGDNAPFHIGTDAIQVRLPNDFQMTPAGDGYITALKMVMRKHFGDDPEKFGKWWRNFLSSVTTGEEAQGMPNWYVTRKLDSNTITNMLWNEMGRSPISDPLAMPYSGGHTPSPPRFMAENKDGVFRLLDRVTEGVKQRYSTGAITEFKASAQDVQRVEEWGKQVEPMISRARAAAAEVGKRQREFTLLDYEKKKGYDLMFGYLFPYQFWYNRTYQNWFRHRLINNAPLIGSYAAYRHGLEKIHAGMPDWWKYNVNTNELFGLDSENPLYFNLEATLNPLNGLTGVDFDNPDLQKEWVSRTITDLAKFGPTVWTPFQIAAAAYLKWNKKDDQAAAALAGRLFPQTAAIRALGALAGKDIELDPNVHIFSDGIEYYERRRIGRSLAALAQQGQISNAQAIEAAYNQEGAIWDQAKMMALQDRAPGQLAAFAGGVGFKGRRQEEIVIDEYYQTRNKIIAQRDNLRPDEYAMMWDQLRTKYPFMDTLILSKRPGEARDQALAYNTFGRIPPGQQDQWIEWAGIPQALVNKFYESKGAVGSWNESDRQRFMAGVIDLQAVLEIPPGTTQQAWNAAKNEYRLLNRIIEQQYGNDISDLVDTYFDLKNESTSQDQPDAFLQRHPEVSQALDFRSNYILNHPVLNKYYGGIDTLERYYLGLMYDDARKLFGDDIFDLQSTYFDIRDAGGNTKGFLYGRSEQLGDHTRLLKYWDWNRAQKDLLAKRIADFGEQMQPLQEAVIRYDAAEDTLGTQAVMAGIFEEQRANGVQNDPELSSLVLQYTTGTKQENGNQLPDVPAVPTADFYLGVPYDYISRFFSPTLRYRLDNHFGRGEPLSEDGIRELQTVWLTLGRPAGSFSTWANSYLKQQWNTGQALPAGQVPAALP